MDRIESDDGDRLWDGSTDVNRMESDVGDRLWDRSATGKDQSEYSRHLWSIRRREPAVLEEQRSVPSSLNKDYYSL